MKRMLAITLVAACSRTPQKASAPAPEASVVVADAGVERRCLPVVSKECGCTYSCGAGEREGDHWNVHHPSWKDSPLRAKITSWCVGDAGCTDAFAAELPCDIVCAPRPADATCHFDSSGACVGSR
ncbi:MAG TPA: hypothetical protein VGH28_28410 [Polyangiaceae bacterium]